MKGDALRSAENGIGRTFTRPSDGLGDRDCSRSLASYRDYLRYREGLNDRLGDCDSCRRFSSLRDDLSDSSRISGYSDLRQLRFRHFLGRGLKLRDV